MEGVEGQHGGEHRDDGEVGDGGPRQLALARMRWRLHLSFPEPTSDVQRSSNHIVQRRSRALRLGEFGQS